MRKRGIAILIFLLILVFGGCGDSDEPTTTGPFFGGQTGLSISFLDEQPLSQFGERDAVPVAVLVTNDGETDVLAGDAKVKLFGLDYDSFGMSTDFVANSKTLRGKSELFPEGGKQEVELGDANYKYTIRNSEEFAFKAKVCYPYETQGRVDVCLSSKLLEEGREEICAIEGEKIQEGTISAGPVQVTSITESLRAADQVRFDIVLKNMGTGDVFNPQTTCEEIEDDFKRLKEKDKVEVEIVQPSGIQCSFVETENNKGLIELDEGQAILTCWMTVDETIKSKMNLRVNYLYVDRTEKTVTIFESN